MPLVSWQLIQPYIGCITIFILWAIYLNIMSVILNFQIVCLWLHENLSFINLNCLLHLIPDLLENYGGNFEYPEVEHYWIVCLWLPDYYLILSSCSQTDRNTGMMSALLLTILAGEISQSIMCKICCISAKMLWICTRIPTSINYNCVTFKAWASSGHSSTPTNPSVLGAPTPECLQ